MTSKVEYQGQLRTKATHLKSKNSILTDAPIDNHGKGETFSPTDLVAAALASCMLTVMGIKAESMNLDMDGTTAEVTKIMSSNPRQISEVKILITMPSNGYTSKEKKVLELTAKTCPVTLSLADSVRQNITFDWQ